MSSVNPSVNSDSGIPSPLQKMLKLPVIAELVSTFQSVQFAIVLIALLAIGTIIGVRFPQEGNVDPQEIEKAYGYSYQYFKTIGFFNVFSSFWFITLQILFFFSLLIGSFKWLKPAYLAATQVNFIPPNWMQSKLDAFSLVQPAKGETSEVVEKITQVLKSQGYKVHAEGDKLYAHKGSITRLGPAIAHVGILMCLLAGFFGLLTGFKALHVIAPGEAPFSIQQSTLFNTNLPKPFWIGSIPDWKVNVQDFHIKFYKKNPNIPQQYYSSLQVVDPSNKVLAQQDISVNHPLLYDNVSIYQASYQPTGRFTVKVNGQTQMMEINDKFNQRNVSAKRLPDGRLLVLFPFFAAQDGVPEDFAVFFVRNPLTEKKGQMPPNTRLKPGQRAKLEGININYIGPEYSTGLQIKKAPEVGFMYLAYLIIGIGTTLCFFSQRQLWISLRSLTATNDSGVASSEVQSSELMIYPKTNKGSFSFQNEISQIQNKLIQQFKQ